MDLTTILYQGVDDLNHQIEKSLENLTNQTPRHEISPKNKGGAESGYLVTEWQRAATLKTYKDVTTADHTKLR